MRKKTNKGLKIEEKIVFNYTDNYIKKKKILKFLSPFISIIGTLMAMRFSDFSSYFSLAVIIFIIFWIFAYSGLGRDFSKDEIYIKDGLIYAETCTHVRSGRYYAQFVIRDITRVDVGEKNVTIFGNITVQASGVMRMMKKLKFPREMTNVDEFIKFAQSKIITEVQRKDALNLIKDQSITATHIKRIDIWNVFKKAFVKLISKAILIESIALVVGGICFLRFIENENGWLLGIVILCAATFIGTLMFSTMYIISEYVIDFTFKRVKRYTGYLSHLQEVGTRYNSLLIPIKHYQGYYHALLYHNKGNKEPFVPVAVGDIKSDPVDGRRLLLKDLTLVEGIKEMQKVEVLYLHKSKIILSVKAVN